MAINRISLHICVRNRPDTMYGLLISLYNQTFDKWDLIIVDESDTPIINQQYILFLLTRMKHEGHCVKYLHNRLRNGIAAARNIAIKNDDLNDWQVRIDDDSVCDKDYLLLLKMTAEEMSKKNKVGAVGGIVPTLGSPVFYKERPKIFNEIIFHKDHIDITDDGGYCYQDTSVPASIIIDNTIESHHLRSSFLFNKKAMIEIGMHPEDIGGNIGWREETATCMKLVQAGYKLYTNINAIAWHARVSYGGARDPNYAAIQAINEQHFQQYWLRQQRLGNVSNKMFTMKEQSGK